MKTVGGKCGGIGACCAAMRGYIDEGWSFTVEDGVRDGVELVDGAGDGLPVAAGGKRGDAPAGYRQYEDAVR